MTGVVVLGRSQRHNVAAAYAAVNVRVVPTLLDVWVSGRAAATRC